MKSKFWQKHTQINKISEYLIIMGTTNVAQKTKLSV